MSNLNTITTSRRVLEQLIFNNRKTVIGICLLVSIFLFWQATLVRPSTSFEKMIPLGHPFIQNMMQHRNDLANLGNTVRISVEAKQGDIFSKEYMETLRQINDEVFYISGVDRSGLKSLWSPSVRWTEVTEEGFAGGEVIPQSYDGSQESLDNCATTSSSPGRSGVWCPTTSSRASSMCRCRSSTRTPGPEQTAAAGLPQVLPSA